MKNKQVEVASKLRVAASKLRVAQEFLRQIAKDCPDCDGRGTIQHVQDRRGKSLSLKESCFNCEDVRAVLRDIK